MIGGTGIDTVVPVAGLPVLAADSAPVTGPIRTLVSHTGTYLARALHDLDLPVTVVDAIGDDEEGRRVTAAFDRWGITLRTTVAPGGTRRAVNLMSPDGRRLSLYDSRETAGFRLPAQVYRDLLSSSPHVHVTIMDWARHLLSEVRAAGCSISTDLHDWDGTNPFHRDFALGADVIFLSAANLRDRRAPVAGRILQTGIAQVVVVTAAADGAYLYRPGRPEVHEPAASLSGPIRDSNGAGDAFAAAFLASWLAGDDDGSCLRRAARAGADALLR